MSEARPPSDLLDRVLRDLDTEQRARVLELVVRLDIDQDDPLWLVAIAIGQLQILVEDAPTEWQELFSNFQGELNQWVKTHLETLEVVADKAELTASLSQYSKELSDVLQKLATACNGLVRRLAASEAQSQDYVSLQKRFMQQTESGFEALTRLGKQQHAQLLETLSAQTLSMETALIPTNKHAVRLAKMAVVLSGFALSGVLYVGWNQQRLLRESAATQELMEELAEQSDWQLENVIRLACASGAKPVDSAECRELVE